MKKRLPLLLAGTLVLSACGSKTTTKKEENKTVQTGESKKPKNKYKHLLNQKRTLDLVDYEYNVIPYDRSASSSMNDAIYFGEEGREGNLAYLYVGENFSTGFTMDYNIQSIDELDKVFVKENTEFFDEFYQIVKKSYNVPMQVKKLDQEVINDVTYQKYELEMGGFVLEEYYKKDPAKPDGKYKIEGHFAYLDGKDGKKKPFYVMVVYTEQASKQVIERTREIAKEVMQSLQKTK